MGRQQEDHHSFRRAAFLWWTRSKREEKTVPCFHSFNPGLKGSHLSKAVAHSLSFVEQPKATRFSEHSLRTLGFQLFPSEKEVHLSPNSFCIETEQMISSLKPVLLHYFLIRNKLSRDVETAQVVLQNGLLFLVLTTAYPGIRATASDAEP